MGRTQQHDARINQACFTEKNKNQLEGAASAA
jgi:hypothetical protein